MILTRERHFAGATCNEQDAAGSDRRLDQVKNDWTDLVEIANMLSQVLRYKGRYVGHPRDAGLPAQVVIGVAVRQPLIPEGRSAAVFPGHALFGAGLPRARSATSCDAASTWKGFTMHDTNAGSRLPRAVLVDVDGTLAHADGRDIMDFSQVGLDRVDETIAEIVRIFAAAG